MTRPFCTSTLAGGCAKRHSFSVRVHLLRANSRQTSSVSQRESFVIGGPQPPPTPTPADDGQKTAAFAVVDGFIVGGPMIATLVCMATGTADEPTSPGGGVMMMLTGGRTLRLLRRR